MPCLFVILAMSAPRLVVALLYFLSHWFDGMFTSALWPVLGFLFMPTTLLWYTRRAALVWWPVDVLANCGDRACDHDRRVTGGWPAPAAQHRVIVAQGFNPVRR